MDARQFVKSNPGFFEGKSGVQEVWAEVYGQASAHTMRDQTRKLIESARPNESEAVKKYREDNIRQITRDGVEKSISKISRIFQESGVDHEGASELLKEWLSTNPFSYLGRRVDVNAYFYNCIFPYFITDPNGLLVAFPYNPEDEMAPPANDVQDGGLAPNKPIAVKSVIVPHERVGDVTEHLFWWRDAEKWRWVDDQNKEHFDEYFWICDKEFFYRFVPKRRDRNTNKLVYELQPWYFHDTGKDDEHQLPVNVMPGRLARLNEDDYYHESYYLPFFCFGDEALNRFSDAQGIWVRHTKPVLVMPEMPCPSSECKAGRVERNGEWETCPTCDGHKVIKSVGVFDTVVMPEASFQGEQKMDTSKAISYVTPDTSALEFINKSPIEYLEMAKRAIGIDVLLDVGESGVAKDKRLEVLEDLLRMMAEGIFTFMQAHLWYVECLLQQSRQKREKPKILLPDYKIRDVETLSEAFKTSTAGDRFPAAKRMIDKMYKDDPVMARAMTLAYEWCPLLLYADDVQQLQLRMLSYNRSDVLKMDRAVMIMTEIAREDDKFIDRPKDDVFKEAEEIYTTQYAIDEPPPLVPTA